MTSAELEAAVLAFVNDKLLAGRPKVAATDRLFEDGHLDSLRVLELIAFVERATGTKIGDRRVRLATFRSARAIAMAFGGGGTPADDPAPLYEYHTDPSRFASPIAELRRRGDLIEEGGVTRLAGGAAQLFRFFDATFARWARELGADDVAAPATIPLSVLERAGFAADFPQLLARAGDGDAWSPAACYHRYAALSGTRIMEPLVLGVHARCRRVEHDPRPLERENEFTMREIVAIGPREHVERVRHRTLRLVDRFVTALALDGAIEAASDPFFTAESNGRALAQQAGELKQELRLTLEGGRRIAVASFNRHHDHFGRGFGIEFDGKPARSGCTAFGIERWVLAFMTQHGLDERGWPAPAREALQIRRTHAAAS
jgi:acyl carrier protein